MTVVNQLLGRLFDALVWPLHGLPPLASLAVLALLAAVAMLLVFRATSDQERIATAKRRIQAGLFEIRLFNDDPRSILQAQKDILRHNLVYVRLSLVPMLWMLVPFALALAQLQSYYGYVAWQPGEAFLLKVNLAENWNAGRNDLPLGNPPSGSTPRENAAPENAPPENAPAGQSPPESASPESSPQHALRPAARLRLPHGVTAETEAVWIPALGELAWRLRAERPGRYTVEVQWGDEAFAKDVRVGAGCVRLSPVRQRSGFGAQLLYPAERPLPDSSPLESIRVPYTTRDFAFWGWRLPWVAVFFFLLIVFALLLRGRLRATL